MSDLTHANDVVLLSEDQSKFQVFLDRLNDSVVCLECVLHMSSVKYSCRTRLGTNVNVVFTEEQLGEVDQRNCLASCNSP